MGKNSHFDVLAQRGVAHVVHHNKLLQNMNLKVLMSLPRSIYYNFKCLPFAQAIKIPILIGKNVKIRGSFHRNSIVIDAPEVYRGMVSLGINDGSFEMGSSMPSYIRMSGDARIVFHGHCLISNGIKIDVSHSGVLHIGKGVFVNSNSIISSNGMVRFGDGVSTGWNITVIDWDGHDIVDLASKSVVNAPKPIIIGDHCWLGSHSTLLKGVCLAHHCIVPYGSIISKSCDTPIAVYGGMPNNVLCTGKVRTDMMEGFDE